MNTAGATIRQLVSLVFERVVAEDEKFRVEDATSREINFAELRMPRNTPPKGLRPCAGDAYLMFQVCFKFFFSLSFCFFLTNKFSFSF